MRVNGLRSLFSFQPFVLLTVDDSDVSATVYGIFESVFQSVFSISITFQAKENLPKFSNALFFLLLVIKSLVVS